MANALYTRDKVQSRAEQLYEQNLRGKLETEPNIGKMVIIDAVSGEYEVDIEGIAAAQRLRSRLPNAEMHGLRIGYDAVYAFGSVVTRTKYGGTAVFTSSSP